MTFHVAVHRIQIRRPTFADLRTVGRLVGYAATPLTVLLAESVDLLWPALLAVAALAGAQVGRLRGAAIERARHIRVMEGLQEVAHQQRLQIARFEDEQRFWWNVGRDPIYMNAPYKSSGAMVSSERSGR